MLLSFDQILNALQIIYLKSPGTFFVGDSDFSNNYAAYFVTIVLYLSVTIFFIYLFKNYRREERNIYLLVLLCLLLHLSPL